MSRPFASSAPRLLIIGGSAEATALAHRVAGRADLEPILSLAGRTRFPTAPPIPFRVGGFGGIAGLEAYLQENKISVVVDASHPFAAQISENAAQACARVKTSFAILTRAPWRPGEGDRWIPLVTLESAVNALGKAPRRVFLSIGGRRLAAFNAAPQHHYLVRAIDPPEMPDGINWKAILARGPFRLADELALMREERIDALVTKNSGGSMTSAKLEAARLLGIEVLMIERPSAPGVTTFEHVDTVISWITDHLHAP